MHIARREGLADAGDGHADASGHAVLMALDHLGAIAGDVGERVDAECVLEIRIPFAAKSTAFLLTGKMSNTATPRSRSRIGTP